MSRTVKVHVSGEVTLSYLNSELMQSHWLLAFLSDSPEAWTCSVWTTLDSSMKKQIFIFVLPVPIMAVAISISLIKKKSNMQIQWILSTSAFCLEELLISHKAVNFLSFLKLIKIWLLPFPNFKHSYYPRWNRIFS